MKKFAAVVSVLVGVGLVAWFASAQPAATAKKPQWQYGMLTLNNSADPADSKTPTWRFSGGEQQATGRMESEFLKNLTGKEPAKGAGIPTVLDAMGDAGWELVQVDEFRDRRLTTYYFKRALNWR
jgi:hypothetical protein